jgi:hypothetical protein
MVTIGSHRSSGLLALPRGGQAAHDRWCESGGDREEQMVSLTVGGVLALGLLAAIGMALLQRWRTDVSLSPVRVAPPSTPQEERGPRTLPPGCGFP